MLITDQKKISILLIFDEIVTGFRFAYGGAQEHYQVTPDICTLGKVIGGGFPLAAIVGSAEIMQHFDKSKVGEEGFLMQLGTLSGNPVACVAGLKTMEILRRENLHKKMMYLQKILNKLTFSLKYRNKKIRFRLTCCHFYKKNDL